MSWIAIARIAAALTLVSAVILPSAAGQDGEQNATKLSAAKLIEFEAELRDYYHYHAEAELLDCLRDAKSDPSIRGTHVVGPGLKYINVRQKRYADFRNAATGLPEDDLKQIEVKIIELHIDREKHIDHARGLYPETTDKALLDYHETWCISGLDDIVAEVNEKRDAGPESP